MNPLLFVPLRLIAFSAFAMTGYNDLGQNHTGLRVEIRPPTRLITAGEPFDTDVLIVNAGNQNAMYYESAPELDFVIEGSGPDGKEVPRTAYGRHIMSIATSRSRNIRITLKPGEAHHYHMRLSLIVDMTMVGKYLIRAKYVFPGPPGESIGPIATPDIEVSVRGKP